MKYTVEPQVVAGCQCEDCRAGRHLYALQRWQDGKWIVVAVSLQSYQSAGQCQQQHWWGIQFEPGATWEDGTPVVPPEPACKKERSSSTGGRVTLDQKAFVRAAEALEQHWLR